MSEEAKKAGRGGLAILVAKVFFIITGFIQQPLLRLAIGQADYGALSRVLAVSNIFNNVVISSSTQGVSRTVAAAGEREREALRATLRVHVVIAVLGATLLAAGAPIVAWYQEAPGVLAPLTVVALVLLVYGVYAPLIGYLNGRALFVRQASLDMTAATLRTAGLVGLGWIFTRHAGALAASLKTSPGVLGAACGMVLAATGVFSLALRWTGTGKAFTERPPGVPTSGDYVRLIAPVMLAQLFVNALMQADIFVLGHYASQSASAGGAADPEVAANEWVAVYRAAQLFAFLPYRMLFSVTQVLFPMVAKAKAEEGDARVAEIVKRGCRIGAIVCGMLVVVVVGMPQSLVKFAYGAEMAAKAATTLRVLGVGQAFFAMLGLCTTILVSLGRETVAMTLTAVALVMLVGACALGDAAAPFGEAQLIASATAVTAALGGALVVGVFVVRRVAGAFVPVPTAVRVGACVTGAWALGRVMPVFSKALTPFVALALVLGYLAVLVVTRELGKDDLGLVLAVAVRRTKR
jgi:stage V sporulation protein B